MPGTAAKIRVSEKQLELLEQLAASRSASKATIQRATIVLLGFKGLLNQEIAGEVGLDRQQVGVWRRRWRDSWASLCLWECTEPRRLREAMEDLFADAPRSGAPPTFTAEQVTQILAVACEDPNLSGRPINRWTHWELTEEVIKRGIVDKISVAQVGRYLLEAVTQPHRSKMWLNTREKDPEKFQQEVENVCRTYLEAPAKFAAEGTHTVSVDEATALQANERRAPDKPTLPGSVAKQEFEYTRHGTTTLTAGLHVVTGQIISPTLESTRTEPEFLGHIQRTVSMDPLANWTFVVDCLNTHSSESLVTWVAAECGITDDLGKKKIRNSGVDGITPEIPVGPEPSHTIRLPPETQFVAESNRNHIRHHPSKVSPRRKLQVGCRPRVSTERVHHLLQPNHGAPVQLDVHR